MRNGFNGLAEKVQTPLKDDPMSGYVFIFRERSGSQVKLLWSTGDGLFLLTKRLERGRFAWPPARDGKVFLTPAQLAILMEGIDWRQPKQLLTSACEPTSALENTIRAQHTLIGIHNTNLSEHSLLTRQNRKSISLQIKRIPSEEEIRLNVYSLTILALRNSS